MSELLAAKKCEGVSEIGQEWVRKNWIGWILKEKLTLLSESINK